MKVSPPKRSAKHLKRSPIKRRGRSKSERERIYGPKGYVEWIHEQPCIACGVVGFSECAHIKTGGMGRKDDWTRTVPLCSAQPIYMEGKLALIYMGCHQLFDEHCDTFTMQYPDFDAAKAARETQTSWIAFQGEKA